MTNLTIIAIIILSLSSTSLLLYWSSMSSPLLSSEASIIITKWLNSWLNSSQASEHSCMHKVVHFSALFPNVLSCTESCLNGTIEPLISGSTYKVQDEFFEADSSDEPFYLPQQARLVRRSWCSDSLTESSPRPWLQITFRMNVNISAIQTGGYNGILPDLFADYHLSRFEVYVSNGTEGSLRPLMMESGNTTRPIVRWWEPFVGFFYSDIFNCIGHYLVYLGCYGQLWILFFWLKINVFEWHIENNNHINKIFFI